MKLAVWLVALCALAGCGGALPADRAAARLHRDIERLATLASAEGWSVDRIEAEEALPATLMSVCRTTPATREALANWLDAEIARRGGPVEAAFEARHRDLDAVDDLLVLTRVRLLLRHAMEQAGEDCPFWLRPQQDFRGRQLLDDRWLLSVGGGGKGMLVRQDGQNDLNFGGAGRILFGRGVGRHATWLAGLELGASAAFPKGADGDRGNLAIAVDLVTPLVYRHRLVNSYWELEGGYIAHIAEDGLATSHGLHMGASFGGSASRRRWLFPGAAFGVSYERIAEERILHMFKIGFRVAFDISR